MARSVRFIPSRARARFPSALARSPSRLRSDSIAVLLLLAFLALPAAAQARPFVYVTNFDGGAVSQYDVGAGGALTPKTPATVPTGGAPVGVAVSPNGASVYVTNINTDSLSQYDVGAGGALTPKSPATVATGTNPVG